MKRKIVIILAFYLGASTCHSQYMLDKGKTQMNAGLGFSSWGLPLYVGVDHGVHKDVSIGAELSYRAYNERWHDYVYLHRVWGISANGNYHFNSLFKIPKDWDLYAGLNLGFYTWSYPGNYPGDRFSGLALGGQAGVRYYFNPGFGLNLEVGGGNAFNGGKFGITYKF